MQKLYCLLFLFFAAWQVQGQNCSVTLEAKDSISYSPFAHYMSFKAKPSGSSIIKKVCWKFGDGTEVCHEATPGTSGEDLLSIVHKYQSSSAGLITFNACVIVYFEGGCVAEKCISFNLQFMATEICAVNIRKEPVNNSANAFLFAAIPENSNGKKPIQVCWKFGDGTALECQTYASSYTGTYIADHHYANPGTYEVCVTVKYEGGCEAKKCMVVTVGDPNTGTCAASVRVDSIANTTNGFIFSLNPEHNNGKKPLQVCWKFGDGSALECQAYAATYTGTYKADHRYAAPGTYEVCATVKYEGGCEAKKCFVVVVREPNTCAAEIEVKPAPNNLVKNIFVLPKAGDRKPVSICWTFGDGSDKVCKSYGSTYTGTYVAEHAFPQPGQYNVCVRVEYPGGCVTEKCTTVVVKESENRCEVKLTEAAGSVYHFERRFYASLAEGRRAEKICWRFSDGSAEKCVEIPNPATTQSLTMGHVFPGPGEYQVCIRVVYAEGCVAEKCIKVIVRSEEPEACGGYMVKRVSGPRSVKLTGFAVPSIQDRNATFSWSFGDGSTGSGKQVEHQYEQTGEYEVCLQIKTAQCTTTICRKIRVGENDRPRLILSPNPATSVIHAQFFSTHNQTVSVRIYNANGILVKSFTRTAVLGENNWDFEIGTLPTGVYSLVVQSNQQFATAIFFKQ